MLKLKQNIITGMFATVVATAVNGQEQTPAAATPTAPTPAKASAPFFKFEGTSLKMGESQHVDFHGFLSQGYLASTDYDYLGTTTDGSFQFTEVGVNATYSPFNRTRIMVQGFAFDTGDVGNLQPFLDYASIEYTANDLIGIRAGRVRKPGGIYNHIQDVDLARTFVLLPQGMYDARWRDFSTSVDGAVLFGSIPLSKAGSLSYELFGGYVNLSDEGGVAQWILDGQPTTTLAGFDSPLTIGGQLWWNTPISGLRFGAYIAHMAGFGFDMVTPVSPVGPFGPIAAYTSAESDIWLQQYSFEYVWNKWTFQAEYSTYKYDGNNTTAVNSGAVPIAPVSVTPSIVNPDVWYASAAYRFNSKFEMGTYYTEHYANKHARSGSPNSSQKDVALSLRFDVKDWWIIKLEGHTIWGTSLLADQANNPNALRTNDPWYMLAVKTTVSF